MRLINARITSYRSVEDSEEFTVEPNVTCLVGKNESGKTTVLQALHRLNPAEPAEPFDEVVDYPARLTRQRKQWAQADRIPVVVATFEYDDLEVKQIEEELGFGALTSAEVTVTIGYRDESRTFAHSFDEPTIVGNLVAGLGLPPVVSVAALRELLESREEQTEETGAVLDRIRAWRDGSVEHHLTDAYAEPRLPTLMYFSDYDIMPGKVSIPDLILRRDADELEPGERSLLSLLRMAGVAPEDFLEPGRHEQLIRELENASNIISDEVFDYWSQNDELEVRLEVLPAADGPLLQIRVHNRRHRASVPFDNRSRGFVWFFSFLAYFSELDAGDRDVIVLLDEPGLSLHGRAQEDLLRLVDERLAPTHQVLYTTHSPFMISPDHLHRVRTVIDHDRAGTKVSADLAAADSDTAFPLLAGMGIGMTGSLFVGEHTLLLEGPSDLIYLDVLSDTLDSHRRDGLDPRWQKAPTGGAGALATFAALLGANRLHVAVIVDAQTRNSRAVRRLRDNGQLGKGGLIDIGEFTGTPDADIEDLFEADFYLDLVNLAYAKELPTPVLVSDLPAVRTRIVDQVRAHFAQHDLAGGRFNHFRPASALLKHQATLVPKISVGTLNRASRLFGRLNRQLP
ncbi:AAA family ATPase [Longispora sp. NPDC051575]|uniref:ATP-dependent nuclease n=1 Tax=Longispora sp. NPDC051575 TaxID=3154943 RepID=UPI003420432F